MPRPRRRLRNRSVESLEPRCLFSSYTLNVLPTETPPSTNVVADGAGNLFGAFSAGGSTADGAIYEFAKGGHTVALVASFSKAVNGASPSGNLAIDSAGDIFGTTRSGGGTFNSVAGAAGTIFELPHGSTTIKTLFSFGDFAALPNGVTLDPATGDLYVTTIAGGTGYNAATGANGAGGIYRLASGATTLTSLGNFDAPTTGSSPRATVTRDAQGNIFGTTSLGGDGVTPGPSGNGYGVVFEIAQGTNSITPVASFSGDNGSNSIAPLHVDSAGNIFGEASTGGASLVFNDPTHPGFGDVFTIATGSNSITVLASFNGTNGSSPQGGLISDGAGNLFGTTYQGGDSNGGTAFELAAGATTITPLHSFKPSDINGSNPVEPFYLDPAGNLWSVTEFGGNSGTDGTLFELALDGINPFTPPGGLTPTLLKTTLPLSIVGGPKLHKTATVRLTNTGGAAIKGRATVRLNLANASNLTSSTGSLGSKTFTVNLKPGASMQVAVPINFDTRSPTNEHNVIVVDAIDPKQLSAQVSTGRTFDWITPVVSFGILNLTASPSTVASGKPTTFSLTIQNKGNISTAQQLTADKRISGDIDLYTDGLTTLVSDTKFHIAATILPGKTKTLKIRGTIAKSVSAGSYLMYATVTGGANPFTASVRFTVQ